MIELIVVILVLGILAAIAIPGFARWGPNMRLKSAVRNLNSDFVLAKLRAIRENANVALIFNTGNNTYTVFVDNGAGGGVAEDWTQNGSEVLIKTITMASDVIMYEAGFSGGVSRCGFNSRGLPINNITGHVYMKNTNDNYRGITLSVVGLVQIRKSSDGVSWTDVD